MTAHSIFLFSSRPLHQPHKPLEQIMRVLRAGACFWVMLHTEHGFAIQRYAAVAAVKQCVEFDPHRETALCKIELISV